VVLTIFIVPAAYLLVYGKRAVKNAANSTPETRNEAEYSRFPEALSDPRGTS